jgi:[methyl-Co(III) methanol-specific corrinoid protein]:coenzyme M methyltransferase
VSGNLVLRMFREGRQQGPVCSSPLVMSTVDQMRHSGCSYPAALEDPQAMATLASAAYTFLGFQGIRVPFDLWVEGEALGCKIRKGDAESPPSVLQKAFGEKESVSVPARVFEKGRFPVVFGALGILKKRFGDNVTIYAGLAGPLTLAGALFDAPNVLRWPIRDPVRMDQNLEATALFLVEYAHRLFQAGCDVLGIIDPTASGDLLSKKHFQRHLIPIYQRMRREIPGPIVLHICGYTRDFLDLLPETGFEAFSFEGPKVEAHSARERIGEKMLLVGNIPTYDVLLFGTPDKVREESLKALKGGIDLLAPSCGVAVQTPSENLKAMVRAAEEFRGDRRGH